MKNRNIQREWKPHVAEKKDFSPAKSRKDYVPCHLRPGFDPKKIIKLKSGER